MDFKDKAEIMSRYPVIVDMTSGMPEKIWEECKMIRLRRGETLFQRADNVTHVYILCKGTAVISSEALSGNEMRVVFVGEGNTIGEMEALASETSMVYNARAYTSCDLIKLSVKSFLEWIDYDHSLCRIMATSLARKLHVASMEASEYTHYDAIVRIATLICSEKCGLLDMTRQELAQTCGVSVRTINRCIKRLKAEGLVSIVRGKIFMSAEQKELLSKSPYNFNNFEH